MIFGSSAPKIELYNMAGTLIIYFNMVQPNLRNENPYFEEFEFEENFDGDLIQTKQYFRFRQSLVFVNLGVEQVDYLIRTANWKEKIYFVPHRTDGYIGEWVKVTRFVIQSHEGLINYTDAEIEFTGIKRRTTIPRHPDYIYTVHFGSTQRSAII
jgi:hypothetical protein